MHTTTVRVQVGPANYFSFSGAIDKLLEFYPSDVLKNALWIYGERAIAAARPYLPAEFDAPSARRVQFGAHCSEGEVAKLVAQAGDECRVVIGVGGGAVLDTAKVAARHIGVPPVSYTHL
ncbi:iron-containing alcohol dehydrogenase, partial [Pectobacterium brasiliense]